MTGVTTEGQRIGLFGGTFDPPHIGHILVAAHAKWACRLDQVLFVVANDPWQKSGDVRPAQHRLAMCELAVAPYSSFRVSDIEVQRGGPSFTIDTVEKLRAGGTKDLVLVVGQDAAAGLDTWHRAAELSHLVPVAVVGRPGDHGAAPAGWRATFVGAPLVDLSSTELRARFIDGRPLVPLVDRDVVAYARRHGLYDP